MMVSQPPIITHRSCDGCGEPARENQRLLQCSSCKEVWYHDATCQKAHYRKHRPSCILATDLSGLRVILDNNGEDSDSSFVSLGRVAIATRDFSMGDIVLVERPAIVFGTEGTYFHLFDAFVAASDTIQAEILDMYHPPVTEEIPQRLQMIRSEWEKYQRSRASSNTTMDTSYFTLDRAVELVAIVSANAHAYDRTSFGDKVVSNSSLRHMEHKSALFTTGSKVEHSCVPNLQFSSAEGVLRYVADTSTRKGGRLSITYCPNVIGKARRERQEFLKLNKAFHCRCSRCTSVDECRPLQCQCKGFSFADGNGNWRCLSCKPDVPLDNTNGGGLDLESEQRFESTLRSYQNTLETGNFYPGMSDKVLAECSSPRGIHPLHYLKATAFNLVSGIAASEARKFMQGGMPPQSPEVSTRLLVSGGSFLQLLLWTRRTILLARGAVSVEEVYSSEDMALETSSNLSRKTVQQLLDKVCAAPLGSMQLAGLVFQAGTDLILGGHVDMALKLFRHASPVLYKWTDISNKNRKAVKVFIESDGKDIRLGNHLLAA